MPATLFDGVKVWSYASSSVETCSPGAVFGASKEKICAAGGFQRVRRQWNEYECRTIHSGISSAARPGGDAGVSLETFAGPAVGRPRGAVVERRDGRLRPAGPALAARRPALGRNYYQRQFQFARPVAADGSRILFSKSRSQQRSQSARMDWRARGATAPPFSPCADRGGDRGAADAGTV